MSPSRRRAWRGARLCLPHPAAALSLPPPGSHPTAITHAHYSCGAMGTSRPTAITLAKFTPASWPCVPPVAVGRDGRPPSPVGAPHPPGSRPTAITLAKFTPASWPCVPPVRVGGAMLGCRASRPLCSFVLKTSAPRRRPIARGGSPPRRPVQNECFLSWFPAVFILSNVFPLCPIWFVC